MSILLRRVQQQCSLWQKFCLKHYSTAEQQSPKAKPSFEEIILQRQLEAQRSIVVQVNSEKSFSELYKYCSAYGQITAAQHYHITHDETQHYIVLEYASSEEAAAAIRSSAYNEDLTGIPAYSPFVWFRAAAGKRVPKMEKKPSTPDFCLSIINGTETMDAAGLNNLLVAAKNIDEQMQLLYRHTQLNDLGVRMRFLAALQVERALSGMFPAANAQPFGSSVNGFGKMGCDLDLILRFDRRSDLPETSAVGSTSRLVFHSKENLANGRSQIQRQMETIGSMLQLFLPGVCHVRRILQARVPIIKYHHEHLNLEVDLSMSNLSGFYMSELLYLFGELDYRVRPLTFCIRRWAQVCGLTNPSPGRWITNFSLTCLVIFFLQQIKQPILPNINALIKAASKQDIRFTEDGINCSFARNLTQISFESNRENKSTLSELLLQFYEFYSQFDFNNRAISLNEARNIAKPDHSALYIVNPLEQLLNVSKNISLEECERLRIEIRNAAWILESEVENLQMPEHEKLHTSWGLLNLYKTTEKSIIRPNMFFKPRMVEVSELFDKLPEDTATVIAATTATIDETLKMPTATATTSTKLQASNNVATTTATTKAATNNSYKNTQVKQQVHNIKTQARLDLKQIRNSATKQHRSS